MKEYKIIIGSTAGIHARLAAQLVQTASKYAVDFDLIYKDKVVDLKSILGLMSLNVPFGETVLLKVYGDRCEEAAAEIYQMLI